MPQSKNTIDSSRSQRKAHTEATWQHHIEQWKKSGLSQVNYCDANDLRIGTFGTWKTKLDKKNRTRPDAVFSAVKIKTPAEPIILEISFPGGISLKIPSSTDPATLLPWITTLRDQP